MTRAVEEEITFAIRAAGAWCRSAATSPLAARSTSVTWSRIWRTPEASGGVAREQRGELARRRGDSRSSARRRNPASRAVAGRAPTAPYPWLCVEIASAKGASGRFRLPRGDQRTRIALDGRREGVVSRRRPRSPVAQPTKRDPCLNDALQASEELGFTDADAYPTSPRIVGHVPSPTPIVATSGDSTSVTSIGGAASGAGRRGDPTRGKPAGGAPADDHDLGCDPPGRPRLVPRRPGLWPTRISDRSFGAPRSGAFTR